MRRRILVLLFALAMALVTVAAPATARTNRLTPQPDGEGWWLAGDDADMEVAGSSGRATVNKNGATISVRATDLMPGHAYTMWIVYFNDGTACQFGEFGPDTNCGGGDLAAGRGGVNYGDGKIVGGTGEATFTARLNAGDGPDRGPRPPDLPGVMPYEPSDYPDFHVVIRSHGPKIPGEVSEQILTFEGGCDVEVGPPPGQSGKDFSIPDEPGECGDIQLYIFETIPAGS
jgi:hypothetical protein